MILGQISYLDCLVFLLFLVPQLLLRVNIIELLTCIVQALPFFCEAPCEVATYLLTESQLFNCHTTSSENDILLQKGADHPSSSKLHRFKIL